MTSDEKRKIDEMIVRQHDGTLTERQRLERGLAYAERQVADWMNRVQLLAALLDKVEE
jgi:uncharacterized protein YeeX (DUF496 family)